MTETKIYVGMNDAVTMKQEHATETFSSVLKNVCRSYHVSFSFSLMQGGYVHEDGRYVQENSLVLQLIDASRRRRDREGYVRLFPPGIRPHHGGRGARVLREGTDLRGKRDTNGQN